MSTKKNQSANPAKPPRQSMTVSLDAALVRSLKTRATAAGRPLSWYVEDLLRGAKAHVRGDTRPVIA